MHIKLAIIDDHPLIRHGIKSLIEDSTELQVIIEASNGKEFIEKLTHSESAPDIALVDISMPVMNGVETTGYLKEKHPAIRVIALSMHADVNNITNMIKAGARAYLLKNALPEIIFTTIYNVYEKGYFYDSVIVESLMNIRDKEMEEKEIKSHTKYDINDIERLTSREKEFIQHCCSERTYKEIADKMSITPNTAESLRESVFGKLGIKSRVGIVLFAINNGLIEPAL